MTFALTEGARSEDYAHLVAETRPAVVAIYTHMARPALHREGRAGLGTAPATGGEDCCRPKLHKRGTGVIVEAEGMIVTNQHVVDSAAVIEVELADGTRLPAELVGADFRTDVALLRVRPERSLPALAFADSDVLSVGARVLALGNPLGFTGSVTAGIVSGVDRAYDDIDPIGFIQHDAVLAPGNSGGPLVDAEGRIVGLNTAIPDPTPLGQGMGLAIPSNDLRRVVAALKAYGHVPRAEIGLHVQQVDDVLAAAFGAAPGAGLLVAEVVADSPAARAGIRVGDRIAAIDGEAIHTIRDFARILERRAPEATVAVALDRGERRLVFDTVLAAAAAPAAEAEVDAAGAAEDDGRRARGLALGIPADPGLSFAPAGATGGAGAEGSAGMGALVRSTRPDGPAAQAGIAPGDVVLAVGSTPVRDGEQARALLRKAEGAIAAVLVKRGAAAGQYVPILLQPAAQTLEIAMGNQTGPRGGPY